MKHYTKHQAEATVSNDTITYYCGNPSQIPRNSIENKENRQKEHDINQKNHQKNRKTKTILCQTKEY